MSTHDHRQENQDDDKLIHENRSFNSVFADDEITRAICRVMRLLIISTHDEKRE